MNQWQIATDNKEQDLCKASKLVTHGFSDSTLIHDGRLFMKESMDPK